MRVGCISEKQGAFWEDRGCCEYLSGLGFRPHNVELD